MKITSDWHIHSHNSCDSACMKMDDLVREARERGILDYGVTDHVHTRDNLPDMLASRREFLDTAPSPRFHFGIEVSCVSRWELEKLARGEHGSPTYGLREGGPVAAEPAIAITSEDIKSLGIEYVIGGTHWPLYVPFEPEAIIRDYHRQNMFLATHPLVDIIAHPWWWMGHWQDEDGRYTTYPWLDDFSRIPTSMHDEFAAAALQHNKTVEINLDACLLNEGYPPTFAPQYLEYLAALKQHGVSLGLGSDCHHEHYDVDFDIAAGMLASIAIADECLWRLPPRPETERPT